MADVEFEEMSRQFGSSTLSRDVRGSKIVSVVSKTLGIKDTISLIVIIVLVVIAIALSIGYVLIQGGEVNKTTSPHPGINESS
jgi:hypothetical protein